LEKEVFFECAKDAPNNSFLIKNERKKTDPKVAEKQCDQIVRFFKVLGGMVSIKSSPNAW